MTVIQKDQVLLYKYIQGERFEKCFAKDVQCYELWLNNTETCNKYIVQMHFLAETLQYFKL